MTESLAATPARQRITQAANSLFLRQGFHATSMRQVARRAGVTPGAIYNHFPNKESLFVDILSRTLPQRALIEALASAEGASASALCQQAFARMGAAMEGQFDNLRLMFVELLEFQGRHAPALAAELLPGFLTFHERLQQADGRLRDFSPVIVGRAFLGLFMSYAITLVFFSHIPGLEPNLEDLPTLADIFLHGVLEDEPPLANRAAAS